MHLPAIETRIFPTSRFHLYLTSPQIRDLNFETLPIFSTYHRNRPYHGETPAPAGQHACVGYRCALVDQQKKR